jgi:hypothetical protein
MVKRAQYLITTTNMTFYEIASETEIIKLFYFPRINEMLTSQKLLNIETIAT